MKKLFVIGLAMLCLSAKSQTMWTNSVPSDAVPLVSVTVEPWNSAYVQVPGFPTNHYYFEYVQADNTNQVYEWTPTVIDFKTDQLLGPPDGQMTENVYYEPIAAPTTTKPLIRRK